MSIEINVSMTRASKRGPIYVCPDFHEVEFRGPELGIGKMGTYSYSPGPGVLHIVFGLFFIESWFACLGSLCLHEILEF